MLQDSLCSKLIQSGCSALLQCWPDGMDILSILSHTQLVNGYHLLPSSKGFLQPSWAKSWGHGDGVSLDVLESAQLLKKKCKNWNNQSNHGSENGAVVHFSMSRFVNFSASRSKRCPMSVVELRRVYLKIGYPKIWGSIIICPYVSQQIAVNGGTVSRMGLLEFSSGHQALLLHGGLMQVKEHEVTINRVESQKVLESRPKGGGTKVSWRDVYWENMWRDLLSVIYWPELNYHSMLLTRKHQRIMIS